MIRFDSNHFSCHIKKPLLTRFYFAVRKAIWLRGIATISKVSCAVSANHQMYSWRVTRTYCFIVGAVQWYFSAELWTKPKERYLVRFTGIHHMSLGIRSRKYSRKAFLPPRASPIYNSSLTLTCLFADEATKGGCTESNLRSIPDSLRPVDIDTTNIDRGAPATRCYCIQRTSERPT